MEKSKKIAEEMGKSDFEPNTGWLFRWKNRYNLAYRKAHGESADADMEGAETREEDDSDEDDVQDISPTPQDINNAFSTIRRCIHCFLPDTYPTIHNIQTKLMQEMARESNARKTQQKITAYTTSK